MDIASGRDNWRLDRERESEGGKEGERDREVDDRGSGLSRPRRGSPANTVAAVQTHKVRTHRQRTLASSSSVCAPQRKAARGLFTDGVRGTGPVCIATFLCGVQWRVINPNGFHPGL